MLAFVVSAALFVLPQVLWDAPAIIADRVFGDWVVSSVLGPFGGAWLARRRRAARTVHIEAVLKKKSNEAR